ncbi:hypothetical protein L484_005448 [Morus notabilis]|uniref:Uncharacterized protein n=1 Tax=Morus notabilis TaxID=981085 RepID=W9S5D7_9ROSA|nr:hypothetical protein L484_005448 [Morus notabilis]
MPVPSQHSTQPICAYFGPCLNQPATVYLCAQSAFRVCCLYAAPVPCLYERAVSYQRALSVCCASAMPPLGMTLTWPTPACGP